MFLLLGQGVAVKNSKTEKTWGEGGRGVKISKIGGEFQFWGVNFVGGRSGPQLYAMQVF